MIEYNKIETVFNRDTTGTKKLIRGDWRNEAVEYLKDSKWQFTEKFDGTNIRVIWDGHYISFAGRTDKATIPQFLLEYLNNTFSTPEVEQLFEQTYGEKQVILARDMARRSKKAEIIGRMCLLSFSMFWSERTIRNANG